MLFQYGIPSGVDESILAINKKLVPPSNTPWGDSSAAYNPPGVGTFPKQQRVGVMSKRADVAVEFLCSWIHHVVKPIIRLMESHEKSKKGKTPAFPSAGRLNCFLMRLKIENRER